MAWQPAKVQFHLRFFNISVCNTRAAEELAQKRDLWMRGTNIAFSSLDQIGIHAFLLRCVYALLAWRRQQESLSLIISNWSSAASSLHTRLFEALFTRKKEVLTQGTNESECKTTICINHETSAHSAVQSRRLIHQVFMEYCALCYHKTHTFGPTHEKEDWIKRYRNKDLLITVISAEREKSLRDSEALKYGGPFMPSWVMKVQPNSRYHA